ncbi:MAG TPA: SRPBCC domain-containing protein [Myxococcales bacterium]
MKPEFARVTTVVEVDPAEAFEVFTREIDAWWKRGLRYRSGNGALRFEGGRGGRLVEAQGGGDLEIGRVLVWEPGERLLFEWRARNFAPGEVTEVEVRFERAERGTRVVLEHRGWEAIPAKHPVRHGLAGPAFTDMMGLWWAELLTSYRTRAAKDVPGTS